MADIEAGRHPPRKTKSAVFSVRFPGDELWEVRRAAQAAEVSVGEFIRQAALARARTREVPAAFAGAVGRALSDIYHGYTATGTPPGESLEDLVNWLGAEAGTGSGEEAPSK